MTATEGLRMPVGWPFPQQKGSLLCKREERREKLHRPTQKSGQCGDTMSVHSLLVPQSSGRKPFIRTVSLDKGSGLEGEEQKTVNQVKSAGPLNTAATCSLCSKS